ncbi:hypothetical protein GCM10028817_19180 [Spirosoma pomorum]
MTVARLIIDRQNKSDLTWISAEWKQPIERIFWIKHVCCGSTRGGHHHQDACKMVLHCPVGSVKIYVQTLVADYNYTLDSNNQYLFLDGQDWRLMHHFSEDAILSVMVNMSFATTAYIDQPYRAVEYLREENSEASVAGCLTINR